MANLNVIEDCKRNLTYDNIVMEFAKEEDDINKCNGCDHFQYDGQIVTCDYCNR